MSEILTVVCIVACVVGVILVVVAFNLVRKGQRLHKGDYRDPEYRVLRDRAFTTMSMGILIALAGYVLYTFLG